MERRTGQHVTRGRVWRSAATIVVAAALSGVGASTALAGEPIEQTATPPVPATPADPIVASGAPPVTVDEPTVAVGPPPVPPTVSPTTTVVEVGVPPVPPAPVALAPVMPHDDEPAMVDAIAGALAASALAAWQLAD